MITVERVRCDGINGKNAEVTALVWTLFVPTSGKWKLFYGTDKSAVVTDGAVLFRPSDGWECESGGGAAAYRCTVEPDEFSSVCDFLCVGAEEMLWRSEQPFFITEPSAADAVKDSLVGAERQTDERKKKCRLKMAIMKALETIISDRTLAERDVLSAFASDASDPQNFDKSIPDFLGEGSYNRDYFAELFSVKYGCTPGEYLGRKKLEYAEKLLSESNLTVREIAEKTGFSGDNYFYRFFKKRTGKTPSEYRKKALVEDPNDVS